MKLVSYQQYAPHEWALLKSVPRSGMKGQDYSEMKCILVAQACISTAWR